ncbi:predicted protein [Naegleria gruberi]|uniref:Predicted protein n=1 Tax=Naegleria gruberi TaxID=5762 RepID=D2V917_NAEGR|nr:uncharacterized protein NAEGRDRAFT_65357 [Naegleria gruberi]EFC46899.1 predicted protein [Naegleria gruberi]|eukprot:XP_002679643.1 predicted protein [Naegleria gruberi strain NEG-M]
MGNRASNGFFSSVSSSSAAGSSSSASTFGYDSCREDDSGNPAKFLNDDVLNNSIQSIRRNNMMIRPSINMQQQHSMTMMNNNIHSTFDNSSSITTTLPSSENKYRISYSSSPPKSILKTTYSLSQPSSPSSNSQQEQHFSQHHRKGHAHHDGALENQHKSPTPLDSRPIHANRSMSITSEDGLAYMLPLSSSSPNASRSMHGNKSPKNRVHPINAFQHDSSSHSLNSQPTISGDAQRDSIFEEPALVDLLRKNRSNSLPSSLWFDKGHVDPKNTIILHSPQKRMPHNIVNMDPVVAMDTPIVCLTLPNEPPVHDHLHVKRPKKNLKKKKRKISRKD